MWQLLTIVLLHCKIIAGELPFSDLNSAFQGLQPIGKLSALLKRPGKAEVLAGTEDVHSPRAPWEIKASTTANATASLARTYAPTPGV